MRIKTFEAPTAQEALALAKMELGEDAVVLNTKHVRAGGLNGLRGGTKVELMAAADENSTPAPAPAQTPAPPLVAGTCAEVVAPSAPDAEVGQLRAAVKELDAMVRVMMLGRPQAAGSGQPLITRLGIDEDIARRFLPECLGIEDPVSLAAALASRMQAFAQPPIIEDRQVIAVVGPTGVGKTTTLAKLAARFALEQGKSVALVTADTFRIGAVEQLRTYARIMGLPLEIALSPEEVSAGVEKHAEKDIVLVDTVGRSQRGEQHLLELKTFVDAARPTQTHLVIAASLDPAVQADAVERFATMSPSRLIVTKLDEALRRGALVNLPLSTGLAISCVTAGQNVPRDIDFADAGRLARFVTEVA